MSDMVFSGLQRSYHPVYEPKSTLRKWYEGMTGGPSTGMGITRKHVSMTGEVVRASGESLLVGGILGAAHAELKDGLDVKFNVGQQAVSIPVDLVVGLAGMGGSILLANEDSGVANDMRNAAASALSILAFRKSYGFMAAKLRARGSVPGGQIAGEASEVESDPIVAKAKIFDRIGG